jgi:pyruvyltransferase
MANKNPTHGESILRLFNFSVILLLFLWVWWFWNNRVIAAGLTRQVDSEYRKFSFEKETRNTVLSTPHCAEQQMPWYWYQSPSGPPWNGMNFGDDYNLQFGAALLGRPAKRLSAPGPAGLWMTSKLDIKPKVIACGSVLPMVRAGDVVAGPGGYFFQSIDFDNLRSSAIVSVRGPDTLALLRNHSIEGPDVFVDPGLLAGVLVWPELRRLTSSNTTCVILHGSDEKLRNTFDKYEVRFLSVHRPPYEIALEMQQCVLVISSSLHGLIFADAFQIPSVWLHSNDTSQRPHKFIDYFSSIEQESRFAATTEDAFDTKSQRPILSSSMLYEKLEQYIRSFPFSSVCLTTEVQKSSREIEQTVPV